MVGVVLLGCSLIGDVMNMVNFQKHFYWTVWPKADKWVMISKTSQYILPDNTFAFFNISINGHPPWKILCNKRENVFLSAHLSWKFKWTFLSVHIPSSSPEPLSQFQGYLAQSILGWRKFKFLEKKDPEWDNYEIRKIHWRKFNIFLGDMDSKLFKYWKYVI
mgnify:CR=1 FL=1